MSAELHDVLRRLAEGDDGAIDDLYSLIYDDLRRVARGQLARERPDHTLGTTALVHESYLRLAGTQRIDVDDRPLQQFRERRSGSYRRQEPSAMSAGSGSTWPSTTRTSSSRTPTSARSSIISSPSDFSTSLW